MSHKYKVIDGQQPTFITLTVIDWVDIFIRPEYTKILDEPFNYCIAEKGLQVHAYVYMTSHLHAIVSSNGEELHTIIRDFKKFTSKKIVKALQKYPESRREWLLKKFSFAAQRINRGANYKFLERRFSSHSFRYL